MMDSKAKSTGPASKTRRDPWHFKAKKECWLCHPPHVDNAYTGAHVLIASMQETLTKMKSAIRGVLPARDSWK